MLRCIHVQSCITIVLSADFYIFIFLFLLIFLHEPQSLTMHYIRDERGWELRSITSCLVEHSLGVVPSLFALCIAHWFTSLSTLVRHDEHGPFKFENFYSSSLIAFRFGLIPLCCADESTKDQINSTVRRLSTMLHDCTNCMHSSGFESGNISTVRDRLLYAMHCFTRIIKKCKNQVSILNLI